MVEPERGAELNKPGRQRPRGRTDRRRVAQAEAAQRDSELRKLESEARYRSIYENAPIIMITGFGDAMIANEKRPPGVDLVLTKPASFPSRGVRPGGTRRTQLA